MPSAGNRRWTHNKNSAVAEMAAQSCTFSYEVRVPHFKALFLSAFWQYHHKSYRGLIILPKNLILWPYFFIAESLGLTSTTVTQVAPISTKFHEIMPNNGHYVVQGHSRSPISVPVESPYAISCYWIILTYILSHTVSNLWCNMTQIFAFEWATLLKIKVL